MAAKNTEQVLVRYTAVEYAQLGEAAAAAGLPNRTRYVHDAALMRMDGRVAAVQPELSLAGNPVDATWQIVLGGLQSAAAAAGSNEEKLNVVSQALARAQTKAKEAGQLVPAAGLSDVESALRQSLLDEVGDSLAAHLRLDDGGKAALREAAQRVVDAYVEAVGRLRNGK